VRLIFEEEGLKSSQEGHQGCSQRLWFDLGGISCPRKVVAKQDKESDGTTNGISSVLNSKERQHKRVRDFDDTH